MLCQHFHLFLAYRDFQKYLNRRSLHDPFVTSVSRSIIQCAIQCRLQGCIAFQVRPTTAKRLLCELLQRDYDQLTNSLVSEGTDLYIITNVSG